MPKKLVVLTEPLQTALKKGAFRQECTQQELVVRALVSYLTQIQHPEIPTLLAQHEAVMADTAATPNPESEGA